MTVRVNLLKASEFRRQGAVSGIFVLRISVGSILAFITLFSLLAAVQFRISRQDLAACREIWRMREPIYDQLQAMKEDLATERKIQQELRGWSASRLEWFDPLLELQRIVPASLQFRYMAIRGELEIREPRGAPPPEEGTGQADAAAPAPPPPAATPMRRFYINLGGRATGRMAEDVVVQFVREIGKAELLKSFLESIKLQSLQRDPSQTGDQADRIFTIEAVTANREMK
jgi:hypothetical protein